MDYKELPNEEILQRLNDWEFVSRFENSDEWKLFREACQRVARQAQENLLNVAANDVTRIIEFQQVVKLYSKVPESLMNYIKQDGELAFAEAKQREIIKRQESGSNP